jgi:hypothetical protein
MHVTMQRDVARVTLRPRAAELRYRPLGRSQRPCTKRRKVDRGAVGRLTADRGAVGRRSVPRGAVGRRTVPRGAVGRRKADRPDAGAGDLRWS